LLRLELVRVDRRLYLRKEMFRGAQQSSGALGIGLEHCHLCQSADAYASSSRYPSRRAIRGAAAT
jgi:hypothetical protein